MNDEQRDRLIIETHRDVQWLKDWSVAHKTEHSRYIYYVIVTAIGIIISMFVKL